MASRGGGTHQATAGLLNGNPPWETGWVDETWHDPLPSWCEPHRLQNMVVSKVNTFCHPARHLLKHTHLAGKSHAVGPVCVHDEQDETLNEAPHLVDLLATTG